MPASKKPRKSIRRRTRQTVVVADRTLLATEYWMAFHLLTGGLGFEYEHYERLGMVVNMAGALTRNVDELGALHEAASTLLRTRVVFNECGLWKIDHESENVLVRALAVCDNVWARHTANELYAVYQRLMYRLRTAKPERTYV